MIYMILFNKIEIYNEDDLEKFIDFIYDGAHTSQQKESCGIIEDYIKRVFEADQKLQKMVSENLSKDLISCVILPYEDYHNFDDFKFSLINPEDGKIRKRDELVYKNYCDICFGSVPGLFTLSLAYYQE